MKTWKHSELNETYVYKQRGMRFGIRQSRRAAMRASFVPTLIISETPGIRHGPKTGRLRALCDVGRDDPGHR